MEDERNQKLCVGQVSLDLRDICYSSSLFMLLLFLISDLIQEIFNLEIQLRSVSYELDIALCI